MSRKRLSIWIGCALLSVQGMSAYAVGPGLDFGFPEGLVPGALNNPVNANSLDLTYHDCLDFTAPNAFTERGYFWVSSFQDAGSVVDSQLNHFLPNGYRQWAKYSYQGEECNSQETCLAIKTRRTYGIDQANIDLFLDPLSDTTLTIMNCAVVVANDGDDILLGTAAAIEDGQKTETDDLINGDFEIVFSDWAFTGAGQALYNDLNGNPLQSHRLVFNGNVTRLRGPLSQDHKPEGSGNIYWLD
jgi:hypothetical protein